jgi:LacI family transcriptional regulator
LSLGHRHIALLKGAPGNVDAEERARGYRDALRGAGIEPDASLEFEGDFTESSGYRCGGALLRLRPRPSAVFAANDYMAIGLLSAMRDAGIEVPRQMAVTGFDDIAIARYLNPPLTTVHIDTYEMGVRAARALIEIMSAPQRNGHASVELPTSLVVRASCGAQAAGGARARAERRALPARSRSGAAAPGVASGERARRSAGDGSRNDRNDVQRGD